MIIEEYDESLFISRFEDYKRVGENKDFSYKGLRFLFEYLEETTDEENPLKLDVISLCCDFSEYNDLEEYLNDYYTTEEINEKWNDLKDTFPDNYTEEDKQEDFNKLIEEEINDKTTLIKFSDDLDEGFIIQQF